MYCAHTCGPWCSLRHVCACLPARSRTHTLTQTQACYVCVLKPFILIIEAFHSWPLGENSNPKEGSY